MLGGAVVVREGALGVALPRWPAGWREGALGVALPRCRLEVRRVL